MIALFCAALSAALAFSSGPAAMTPQEKLIARMMVVEVAQDGDLNRASGNQYHGQCRRFQADSLLQAAQGFALEGLPGLELCIPLDHLEAEGRPVGSAWSLPEDGKVCAYDEAAVFVYDTSIPQKENLALAKAFLSQVQAGDVLQMNAVYNSGARGTHTVLISQPYDARNDILYWCDSNFANKKIDGVRYAYVRPRQEWSMRDVSAWIAADQNTAATLYRLREDIVETE